jgi:hypothetical protein
MASRLTGSKGSDDDKHVIEINYSRFKTFFDWGWKALAALWCVFQFYSNQTGLLTDRGKTDDRIRTLETSVNQMQRDLGEQKATVAAIQHQQDSDRQYYLLTHK